MKDQRVVTFLNRDEVDFLDKVGKDALFSTGLKLPRARIIAWLIDLAKELRLNGDGIKSEKDFQNRFIEVFGGVVKGSVPASHGKNLSGKEG